MFKKLIFIFCLFLTLSKAQNSNFIIITDEHLGFGKTNNAFLEAKKDIQAIKGDYPLVINLGDITERGYKEEYTFYSKNIQDFPLPIINLIGNHEVYWCPYGKKLFRDTFSSETYQVISEGDYTFLLLDTALELAPFGHIEEKELYWLKEKLNNYPPDKPLVLFSHHPLYWSGESIDNGWEFFKIIEEKKVLACFFGHGHKSKITIFNGIPMIETGALYNGEYRLVKISGDTITTSIRDFLHNKTLPQKVLTYSTPDFPFQINSPKGGEKSDDTITLELELKKDVNLLCAKVSGGKWQKLAFKNNPLKANFNLASFPAGYLYIEVRAVDKSGGEWRKRIFFTHKEETFTWKGPAGEIISNPLFTDQYIYLATKLGNIYCLELYNGKQVWECDLKENVFSPLESYKDNLLVGTLDGNIYEITLNNGNTVWEKKFNAPIWGGMKVREDNLIFSTGDSIVYNINCQTGKVLWQSKLGYFSTQTPVVTQDKVLLGSWDGKVYALDLQNGKIIWSNKLSNSIYRSPALGEPVVSSSNLFINGKKDLYCLDIENGKLIWEREFNSFLGSPITAKNLIFIATAGGTLVAMNQNEGNTVWQLDTQEPMADPKMFINSDKIYITTARGLLLVISTSGKLIKKLSFLSQGGYCWRGWRMDKVGTYIGFLGGEGIFVPFKNLATNDE